MFKYILYIKYDKNLQIISCDVCANVEGYYNYRYLDIFKFITNLDILLINLYLLL